MYISQFKCVKNFECYIYLILCVCKRTVLLSNKTYFTLPAYNWILQVTEIHQEVT